MTQCRLCCQHSPLGVDAIVEDGLVGDLTTALALLPCRNNPLQLASSPKR